MNHLLGLLAFLLAGYLPAAFATDEWLKDEVLKQLSELRQDNARLHQEMDALKRQWAERGSGKGAQAAKPLAELIGGHATLGNQKAKVVVVEFTDYQCPFCRKFGLTVFPKFRRRYIDTGQVLYVLRDFPLAFHAQAQAAAVAARCAGRQNAYWAMKQQLFEHQAQLGRDLFLQLAKELKLDAGKLQACLDDPVLAEAVNRDVAYGNRIGVQATPTFLIGRIEGKQVKAIQAVSGAMGLGEWPRLLDAWWAGR